MSDTAETREDTLDSRDKTTPPGWDYNPATWPQRIPIIGLALLGGVVAFYLTLFQWNVVRSIWEPFFSGGPDHQNGSVKILKSTTSELFPWPFTDGFLGTLGYVGDAVFGIFGGTQRWRTMPWVVIVFGILVGPLGAVSIGLVITQPLAYSTFCTLCVVTAIISVLMIGPAMDEMLASLQYLKLVRERGLPFWRYFWGRGQQEYLDDPLLPKHPPAKAPERKRLRNLAIAAQITVAVAGVYLMAAPAIWGYAGAPEKIDRFIGPLVASFATMAAWEILRGLRWVNVGLALALAALALSPWPWRHSGEVMISDVVCAGVIIGLSIVKYPRHQRYGGGWRRLLRDGRSSLR